MRPSGRTLGQIRPVTITRQFTSHAEGSVLIEFGDTKVICTASVEVGVPRFLKGQVKAGLQQSTACYLVQHIPVCVVKQLQVNKVVEL